MIAFRGGVSRLVRAFLRTTQYVWHGSPPSLRFVRARERRNGYGFRAWQRRLLREDSCSMLFVNPVEQWPCWENRRPVPIVRPAWRVLLLTDRRASSSCFQ